MCLLEGLGSFVAIGWTLVPHHMGLSVGSSEGQQASSSVSALEKRVSKNTQDARFLLCVIGHTEQPYDVEGIHKV